MTDTPFTIAGRTFTSRLIVGTGKYSSHAVMAQAHAASGADMVTVAVRRVNISDRTRESLLDYIDTSRMFILPNTAGCYSADEAVRTALLGREAGLSNWVKLEVIGDERTLFPDNEALLEATRILVREGFVVLDTAVTPELEAVGVVRDVVRAVQMRTEVAPGVAAELGGDVDVVAVGALARHRRHVPAERRREGSVPADDCWRRGTVAARRGRCPPSARELQRADRAMRAARVSARRRMAP